MKSRSRSLVDKSLGAMIAAIEVYNKPDFAYREETFSILAINAWELLLKARILQIDNNRVSSIIEYERRKNVDGTWSIQKYRKKNRSGNHVSIGLFKAFDLLTTEYGDSIDSIVRKNLEALTEIRDNSIHFFNKDYHLAIKVQEIGTASLKNYLNAVRQWFGVDLSKYNFFLMPISFFRDFHTAEALALNGQEKKILKYISDLQSDTTDDETNDFNFSLQVDVKFRKVSSGEVSSVAISNDPNAVTIRLEEESIREKYPWDYKILSTRLRKRYTDFKENNEYHQARRPLEADDKFCMTRLLDPSNPNGSQKKFYNPNIIKEFDNIYKRLTN